MPSFVIHEIGQEERTLTLDKPLITIGRRYESDIQLVDVSVSREHATLKQSEDGEYWLSPNDRKKLVSVNGHFITNPATLQEGDELQIGQFLIIFSWLEGTSDLYQKYRKKPLYSEGRCNKCGWSGRVGAISRKPTCPRCGASDFTSMEELKKRSVVSASTAFVSPEQMAAIRSGIHLSHNSYLKMLSEAPGAQQVKLNTDRRFYVGKKKGADLKLRGFCIGKNSEVYWEAPDFVIEHRMLIPAMKVNGKKVKQARLKPGDIVEIGQNRFRYYLSEA